MGAPQAEAWVGLSSVAFLHSSIELNRIQSASSVFHLIGMQKELQRPASIPNAEYGLNRISSSRLYSKKLLTYRCALCGNGGPVMSWSNIPVLAGWEIG
jgi:hypothetical protein